MIFQVDTIYLQSLLHREIPRVEAFEIADSLHLLSTY